MSQKNLSKPLQYTRKKIQNYSYGLNDQIGKGYSSQVFRGRNDQTDQPVAIKVIDLKMLKSQINRSLLASEIDILKGLKNSPNILALHEVYTTKNNTYIITELCQSDLSKAIKRKLTESEVLRYMKQLIYGYTFVYQADIIHRDLKPANLLITAENCLKIADFGFGIQAQQVKKPSKYNVGSPLYMAPQSLRKNQYSFKSDIWAIGVIFYEMLTTETPWRAKNQKQLLKKIEAQKIEIILQKKDFNPLIKQFLTKALNIDKNLRMSPQQLAQYPFNTHESLPYILSEKKLNLTFKYQTLASQVSTPHRSKDKINLTNQKSEKRILNPIKQIQTMQSNDISQKYMEEKSPQKSKPKNEIKNESNPTLKKEEKKNISKILIAEVHFCRFLYKLLMRIKQSCQSSILINFRESIQVRNIFICYTKLIKFKLQKIVEFSNNNFMKMKQENHLQYQETSDFKKLLKISKQYTERYSKELNEFWKINIQDNEKYYYDLLETVSTNALMLLLKGELEKNISLKEKLAANTPYTHIRKHSFNTKINQENIEVTQQINCYSKDIIILDYLMTARQLLDILKDNFGDHEKFARKSRIEEIVEGATAHIDLQLYIKILERAALLLEDDKEIKLLKYPSKEITLENRCR